MYKVFLSEYGIPANAAPAKKYATYAAEYYRQCLKAKVMGRPVSLDRPDIETGL